MIVDQRRGVRRGEARDGREDRRGKLSRGSGDRLRTRQSVGVGTDTEKRHGELNLAATRPVGHGLHAGLDARLHTDLERDDDEPPGEREWDLRLGPIATLPFGRYALSVGAGLTASKLRHAASIDAGAIVLAGLAAVF